MSCNCAHSLAHGCFVMEHPISSEEPEAAMRVLISIVLGWLLCTSSNAANFDFENLPDGSTAVLGLDIVGGTIAVAGLTLNEFEVPPHSGQGVLFASDLSLEITFSQAVQAVSGFLTYAVPVEIVAMDINGAVLSTLHSQFQSNLALSGDAMSKPNEVFQFTGVGAIAQIAITAGGPQSFALDDLTIVVSSPIPEPSSFVLAILGLAGIGAVAWRRGRLALGLPLLLIAQGAGAQTVPMALALAPQNIAPGIQQTLIATLVTEDPSYIAGSAILYEVDGQAKPVRRLATFNDGGVEGDEVPGDGISTARVQMLEGGTKQLLLAASVALKGQLTRQITQPAVLWVTTERNTNAGFAVAEESRLVFRSAAGQVANSLPLQRHAKQLEPSSSGDLIIETIEVAAVSELQNTAAVLSHQFARLASGDEGFVRASTLHYFSASGVQLFQVQAQPDRVLFSDAYLAVISRRGDRVLIMETDDDGQAPSGRVVDASGSTVFSIPMDGSIVSLSEARITSTGRLIGLSGAGADGGPVIQVIDVQTGSVATRTFSADAPGVLLRENVQGGFSVLAGGTVGETLP